MARTDPARDVQDYRHDATRKNNPPAGLAAQGRVAEAPGHVHAYDPHLPPALRFDQTGEADRLGGLLAEATERPLTEDEARLLLRHTRPWLEWAGKREKHRFEVDPVALHVHERVSAQAVVRAARRQDVQRDLFADPQLPFGEAVKFYEHDVDWSNRLILGDSLQVMASLARREGLAGQVQMVYLDPPYGIKFKSNFQPKVGDRNVGETEADLTREPEMVKAYRDTWRLGIHSYLDYLRDRLVMARELLRDSGSVFVQIGDENVHRVRAILDEVFGVENFCAEIAIQKSSGQTASLVAGVFDILLWYAKDRERVTYRQLYTPKPAITSPKERYVCVETEEGEVIDLSYAQKAGDEPIPEGRILRLRPTDSQTGSDASRKPFMFWDDVVTPPGTTRGFSTSHEGLLRASEADRLYKVGNTLVWKYYRDQFPFRLVNNLWMDLPSSGFGETRLYVVQTEPPVIERCMLMTTKPGDLVLDPTCGSGTTAYVAEQWGRRWITIDTSRVAVALARQRLLTATYPYYRLKNETEEEAGTPSGEFVYKQAAKVQLRDIANAPALDAIAERHGPLLEIRLDALNQVVALMDRAEREALGLPMTDPAWREGGVPADSSSGWPPALAAALRAYHEVRAAVDAGGGPTLDRRLADLNAALEREADDALRQRLAAKLARKEKAEGKRSVTEADRRRWRLPESGRGWRSWEVPFDADEEWPKALAEALRAYRTAWRAKRDEVEATIVSASDPKTLYDQPEVEQGVVRVSGPFSVEAVMPAEASLNDADSPIGGAPDELDGAFSGDGATSDPVADTANAEAYLDKMVRLLRDDGVRFLGNTTQGFDRLDRISDPVLHAEGEWTTGDGAEQRVAVSFGPEHGPVTARQVEEALRAAYRRGYDALVFAGFTFDGAAQAVIQDDPNPNVRVHMANVAPDVMMDDLLKKPADAQLFTVFGQPRTRLVEGADGSVRVAMEGMDVYDPVKNALVPTKAQKVAAWFVDHDYDGRTFCIGQAFFPDKSAWKKLKAALKTQVDADVFDRLSGTESLPFTPGRRVAVKVIDPRGNEALRVHDVAGVTYGAEG